MARTFSKLCRRTCESSVPLSLSAITAISGATMASALTLTITCICCYDEIKGVQGLYNSLILCSSHSLPLFASLSLPLSLVGAARVITCLLSVVSHSNLITCLSSAV